MDEAHGVDLNGSSPTGERSSELVAASAVERGGGDAIGTPTQGAESAAERDAAADLRDEAAARRDLAGDERDASGDLRDRAAGLRDQIADHRDSAGEERDRAASQRDENAIRTDALAIAAPYGFQTSLGMMAARWQAASDRACAADDRKAGAGERSQSEHDRQVALDDRGAGADDRAQADEDRTAARSDRQCSAAERVEAAIDDLTGAYRRRAGRWELERDMARANRAGTPLCLAFIDVDRLKAVNDTEGHAAGDRLLVKVATTLRGLMRSYDLLIRYGGDEFLCVLSGLTGQDARLRLGSANTELGRTPGGGSITMGVADMRPEDLSDDLIARADVDLYRQRQRRVDQSL